MPQADLILNLVRASRQGDQTKIQKTVEAIAANERAKNHTIFADKLLAELQQTRNGAIPLHGRDYSTADIPFVVVTDAQRRLSDLVLRPETEQIINDLLEEQHRAAYLRKSGLEPRNRVLLAGPPGNGKTALVEAIAHELGVPLMNVRYETLIGKYLGQTTQQIGQLFQQVSSRRCVLFFDEFDCVGKERGDEQETGEIKRVVASLLLQIDGLPSHVVVAAASNHPEILDRAVWRRFQIRLGLPRPTLEQTERWFEKFQHRTGHDLGFAANELAQRVHGACFAEIEDLGLDILRSFTLADTGTDIRDIAKRKLGHWEQRYTISTPAF